MATKNDKDVTYCEGLLSIYSHNILDMQPL